MTKKTVSMRGKSIGVFLGLLCCLKALPGRAEAIGGDFRVENGVLTKYNGAGGAVMIPETVNGQTIVEIGDGAFRPETNTESQVTSVTIPGTVKAIGVNAFEKCGALGKVIFGGSEAEWYAIPDTGGNGTLPALTQAGKVEFADSPVTGEWAGSHGLCWSYSPEMGMLSYTGQKESSSAFVLAAFYQNDRMLSFAALVNPSDGVVIPDNADTVKLFLMSDLVESNLLHPIPYTPLCPACTISRGQLAG